MKFYDEGDLEALILRDERREAEVNFLRRADKRARRQRLSRVHELDEDIARAEKARIKRKEADFGQESDFVL